MLSKYWKVHGTSHRRSGMACQDAGMVNSFRLGKEKVHILAVADGHGDKAHDLSQYGSEIAVHTSQELLQEMCRSLYQSKDWNDQKIYESFKMGLIRNIVRVWKEKVLEDAKNKRGVHLPSAEEDDAQEVNNIKRKIVRRYGSTLLMALITDNFIFIGQIGDGDITLTGESTQCEKLLQKKEELTGEQTYSLCMDEAINFWEVAAVEKPKEGLLTLSTDGLSKSFVNDNEITKVCGKLYSNFQQYSFEEIDKQIPKWLDDYSQRGSADDITLTIAYFQGEEQGEENEVYYFFSNLSKIWRKILSEEIGEEIKDKPTEEQIDKILAITHLFIPPGVGEINDLEPISYLKNLEEFYCMRHGITDLTALKDLKNLKKLSCILGNSISEEEIKKFKDEHPYCEIKEWVSRL